MKLFTGVGLAGLALVVGAAPVAAFGLAGSPDHPVSSPASPPASSSTDPVDEPTDDPGTDPGTDPADDAGTDVGAPQATGPSAAGTAHAAAMKVWARCVADAASGPKTATSPVPPKTACGDKPVGPGRAAHAPDGGSVPPAPHSHPNGHANAHAKAHGR